MPETLRPMSLGEILDRTIQLYRARFLVFFGIAVLPIAALLTLAVAVFLSLLAASSGAAKSATPAEAGFLSGVLALVLFLLTAPLYLGITALAEAALNHAVARSYLADPISIRAAYKAVWPKGWRYVGLYLLKGLIVYAAPVAVWSALVLIAAGIAAVLKPAGALIGLLGFAAFGVLAGYMVWMLLSMCLSFPASVVEQIGPWSSIQRSRTLSKGTRGRIFLLYLLGAALNWLLVIAITIPVSIAAALIPGMSTPQHSQALGVIMLFTIYGGSFAVQALTRPVYGIALLLFYYDQRIRKEAFDIEWMMQKAGLVVPETAPAGSEPPPAPLQISALPHAEPGEPQ